MTVTKTIPRRRFRCVDQIVESFWLPSYHHGELIDAAEVTWTGGKYATARYSCPCCRVTWTEQWPTLLVLGLDWRHRYDPPLHQVAGVDAPRHLVSDRFTPEGILLAR